jgi:small-conductance mechanosensitive channel
VASLADLVRLPPLALLRAFDDLHTLAQVGSELTRRMDELESRADDAVELLERLDSRADEILALGASIDARGQSIVELGEQLNTLGTEVHAQGVLIEQRAAEVAERGAELVATLPTLEAAVNLVTPLEGAVERLGRMVDRLPGGARRPGTS